MEVRFRVVVFVLCSRARCRVLAKFRFSPIASSHLSIAIRWTVEQVQSYVVILLISESDVLYTRDIHQGSSRMLKDVGSHYPSLPRLRKASPAPGGQINFPFPVWEAAKSSRIELNISGKYA